MVSFDAAQPGTPARVWDADPRLHKLPALQVGCIDEVVVIGAHPDDETLGAGGLIRLSHDAGIPVRIICVTDGGGSHPGKDGIVETRAEELARAIEILAPGAPITMLGVPDGHTREYREQIAAKLATVLSSVSERSLLVTPWRGDGHADHRIVGEIIHDLADGRRVIEYPIWMWHWASPDHTHTPWEKMASLPITGARKRAALSQFASQISGDTRILRTEFLEHFDQDREIYIMDEGMLGRAYFDTVYATADDPWRFRTRWYEQRKRTLTLAILPHPQYRRGLEIGCSIGILTEQLASRCENLVAVDLSERAVVQAREQVGSLADIRCSDVLTDFPDGRFDLIVLSEVGYYWGQASLRSVLQEIGDHLTPGGTLVACHWRHPVQDYPMSGDEVHADIAKQEWTRLAQHIEADFILEVFSDDARSVAEHEGLL